MEKRRIKMQLSLSQSQAKMLRESLKLYNTQLLTSAEDWRDYDNLFEKLANLSDTRGDAVFNNDPYEVPSQSNTNRIGKDMDLI